MYKINPYNMKKIKLLVASLLFAGSINAQLVDEQNVTITMDLQPILQLNMDGPSNIDFVFDEIYEYMGGITKYGATTLKVSASVDWDLYAVGYSSGNTGGGAVSWDNQVSYGVGAAGNGSSILSCSLLELRQNKANPANLAALGVTGGIDYSSPFLKTVVLAAANNCIYTNAAPYTLPAATDKFIAGGNTTAVGDFVQGGSYLTAGASGNYFYVIDYRIVPGLPAVFPNAFFPHSVPVKLSTLGAASHGPTVAALAPIHANPGVYTMNVKYVLREN